MGIIVWVLKKDGAEEMRTLVGRVMATETDPGLLVFEPIEGPFEPTETRPAVILAPAPMGAVGVYDAVEREDPDGQPRTFDGYVGKVWTRERRAGAVGPMANGRFVWTADGRFPAALPLRYFDRWETPAQYASYD